MKKLITSLFAFAAILSMTVLSSCGGGAPDVKDIIKKYDAGEKLTEGDYSELIDYLEASFDELIPLAKEYEKINTLTEYEDRKALKEKIFLKQFEYANQDKVGLILDCALEEELGMENYDRFQKLLEEVVQNSQK